MKGLISTLAVIWRLAIPYFKSEDRKWGLILLGAVVGIELSLVGIEVLLNQWNNRFYNALQDRNWDSFVSELIFFCGLAAAFIVLAVYQLYLNQWLQIRWRRWMTQRYLGHWLSAANHYRMQLLGDAADNPDQRIAEDIRMFIELTLTIGIGLLSSVVTLASFVAILWVLSAGAPASPNTMERATQAMTAEIAARVQIARCGVSRFPCRAPKCPDSSRSLPMA